MHACVLAAITASAAAAAAVACPPGFYATPATSCTPCAKNTYRSGLDPQSACLPCATGSTSPEAASACTQCPAGYTIDNTGTCKPCSPNTFNPTPGAAVNTTCQPCPDGLFALFGASACAACPPGRYVPMSKADAPSPEYVGDCIDCAANTYSDEPDSRTCMACPAGTTSKPGSKACDPCPAGSYLMQEDSWDPVTCEPCPAGSYSMQPMSQTCRRCPFGSTSAKGSTSCELCPAGSFVDSSHDSYSYGNCTVCPRNTYNDKPGYSGAGCKLCPAGFTAEEEGATECELCPAGSYVDVVPITADDVAHCYQCPPNTFSTQPGTVGGCSPCPNGTWSLEGSTECTRCPPGTYGSGSCTKCPPATYQDEAGAKECKPCPPGFTTLPGAKNLTQCKICPTGSYVKEESGECVPCPKDTYSTACKPGYFAAQAGDPCKACPPGTFASANGSTSCTPCAPGTTHFGRARTSQNECTVAHVAGTTITATETFVDRYGSYGAYRYDGLPSITSKTLVSTAPVRTITLVTGGDPVAAPPGYTECVTFFANGLVNTSAPETSKYDPPHPTFAVRYSVFEWTKGNVVGGPGTDDFALVVEYSDGGFQICGASRGADGTLKLSCEYDIKAGESLNIKFRQAETLTLTSVAGA
ncbi:hypothetical protein HYH03_005698 [Edaphochlamys debaryana]|uniref:Tyrosine-protein kinase ephrin type A/B receptor-like domain-containing protein n=1 Tax=Edaphochlamys debaryana TaxID=47281 RepID=A0A835Y4S2_9CHLO|nr:hypothetical protein HYH03_005698 [Edaphochlamys debaryana]|eukprot:KAG2496095.1 hypothetical protein HYH03_005698 [Edaphochlamys debaryana]